MDKRSAVVVSAISVLTAAVIGGRNGPQHPGTAVWYARLRKPGYAPPGPVIGVAWSVLDALLVVTGYRLLKAPNSIARQGAIGAWALTLVGLAGYPWLFFGRRRLASSAGAAGAMFASAAGLAYAARKVDPPAAALTAPLVLWLGFATVISEELWRRNPRLSRD